MTAVANAQSIVRFKASRVQPCAAAEQLGWACEGIQVGERAGYVGPGHGLQPSPTGIPPVCCGGCLDRLENGASTTPGDPVPPATEVATPPLEEPAPTAATAEPDSWEMTAPEALVMPPSAELATVADLQPWDGPLCRCARGSHTGTGFARSPESGRWVHTGCGLPAIRGPVQENPQPVTGPGAVVEHDGPAATPHQPDPTEPPQESAAGESAAQESDADRAADAAHQEWLDDQADDDAAGEQPAGGTATDAPKTCDCGRVSKKAKVYRDAAGRAIHEHCGGQLRDKHMHLAPPLEHDETSEAATTDPEQPEETYDDQPAEHVDDPDEQPAAGDTGDPGVGQPPGADAGALRRDEGRGGPDEEGPRGADGRDQGRGQAHGAGVDGHGDPQPVPAGPAGAAGAPEHAPGHQADAGRAPAAVREPHQAHGQLDARPGEVGPLAAFWAQPAHEDESSTAPEHTLADFWGQPTEGDGALPVDMTAAQDAINRARAKLAAIEQASWGAPTNDPDSDNYLGEFSIVELLAEVGRRREIDGRVTALIVAADGERYLHPRVLEVMP